ncbi:hypothetical protein [Streptomyces sp. ISL-98]|nr:hypothetical protein [Streptomyces sp. ISL-98]
MATDEPRPCSDCHGSGGRTEDTSGDGVARQTGRSCQSCHGTGTR